MGDEREEKYEGKRGYLKRKIPAVHRYGTLACWSYYYQQIQSFVSLRTKQLYTMLPFMYFLQKCEKVHVQRSNSLIDIDRKWAGERSKEKSR